MRVVTTYYSMFPNRIEGIISQKWKIKSNQRGDLLEAELKALYDCCWLKRAVEESFPVEHLVPCVQGHEWHHWPQ